ncbi:hypothetical protein TgHK011_005789 [Trichoderma gracile]|nr:hypothetical protein TgHK011_005789 [Trichoderma gracile]
MVTGLLLRTALCCQRHAIGRQGPRFCSTLHRFTLAIVCLWRPVSVADCRYRQPNSAGLRNTAVDGSLPQCTGILHDVFKAFSAPEFSAPLLSC